MNMVVRPEDCKDGNAAFEAAVKKYTDHIDAYLKANWYKGCPGVQISRPQVHGTHNIFAVQERVKSLYTAAGWTLSFESSSDPREPSESWISVKLATMSGYDYRDR